MAMKKTALPQLGSAASEQAPKNIAVRHSHTAPNGAKPPLS